MKRAAALLALLFLAGCLGPTPNPSPVSVTPAPTSLTILVTDTEWVPIPGALLFVVGSRENYTTNEHGEATVPAPTSNFTIRAWSPTHYRAEANGTPNSNATNKFRVELQHRPDDVRYTNDLLGDGLCHLGVGAPSHENRCRSTVDCYVPFATCGGPTALIQFRLPEGLHNISGIIDWDDGMFGQDLHFVVELVEARGLPLGDPLAVLEGPSPIPFAFDVPALGPDYDPERTLSLRFTSSVPGDNQSWGTAPVAFSQPFTMGATAIQVFRAAPNPPW